MSPALFASGLVFPQIQFCIQQFVGYTLLVTMDKLLCQDFLPLNNHPVVHIVVTDEVRGVEMLGKEVVERYTFTTYVP